MFNLDPRTGMWTPKPSPRPAERVASPPRSEPEPPALPEGLDPTGMATFARTLRCATCGGANVSIAVWLDVRQGRVSIGDVIHDVNDEHDWSSIGLSAVQYCEDCEDHRGLVTP